MSVRLLDCTLRDGGFVNDWKFGNSVILNIFKRLVKSNIEYIELGFLDDRVPKDLNRTIMPDTQTINEIFGRENKGKSTVLAMIDYGTCGIDSVQPCDETFIDGIRVIFKKSDADNALAFCQELKNLGYKVFVQPVSITSYSESEIVELVKKINDLHPYSMAIVDTYGLLHKDNLLEYFKLINQNLNPAIGLGYHSHNNFQLSYSNCIELLRECQDNRALTLDASLYGMGKSAGNANTELVASYLNNNYHKKYDIDQILEAIDVDIMNIYAETPWGYSLPFYLAAINDCHPSYVQWLINKKTLSIKDINILLQRINNDKLSFNQDLIEKLYEAYQSIEKDDNEAHTILLNKIDNYNIMILGPGASLTEYQDKITELIEKENLLVFSTNFIPEQINIDYLFISNAKRYSNDRETIVTAKKEKPTINVIGTSNINQVANDFDFVLNYANLLKTAGNDNSLIMLLAFLKNIGKRKIYLAGFDGFAKQGNYVDSAFDFDINKIKFDELNDAISQAITKIICDSEMELIFLTPSIYDERIGRSKRLIAGDDYV